jgi:putative ATP-dependent endonuclease of OLD family
VHGLSRVRIVNFRSCIDTPLQLADFTPMVGCNNGGKSNILAAVKWLLRPQSLAKSDFCDPDRAVSVEGEVSGITEEILKGLDERHRTKIDPYCTSGSLAIRRYQASPGMPKLQIELQVLDADDESEVEGSWKKAPTGIPEALYAMFPEPIEIGAMEDAAEDAAKFKTSTTIGKLIADIIAPIQEEHGEAIRRELEGLRCKLDADGSARPKQLEDFDREANDALQSFFPGIKIRLHIPAPELDQLFKTGTIKTYEQDGIGRDGRDITCLGHGAQRAVQMALIQCLAQKGLVATGTTRRLLIVEEPELYMHPQGVEQVRVALKQLSKAGYQVLISTHSPLVIESEDVPDTLLIRKTKDRGTEARQTLRAAAQSAITDYPSQAQMLLSLSNSSRILFADRVILTEGKTEQRLIPSLFAKSQGKTLGLARVALVSQGGVDNTGKSMAILSALDLPCKAVVDLDYAFRGAIRDGFLEKNDKDVASCKDVFKEIALTDGCNLDAKGLPAKGGALTAPEAFAKLGVHENAIPCIESLHTKLLNKKIWVWKLGCMDNHLGLDSKAESAWAEFLRDFDVKGFGSLPDDEGVVSFLKWLGA